MIDYGTIANVTGNFPDAVSKNCSTPLTKDGTSYFKPVIDDVWGAAQALMHHAGLNHNATAEIKGNSQRLTAIQRVAGHPGEIIAWAGNDADPSDINIRLLPLNGQTVLRTNYPDLDIFTYVGDPDNHTAPAFYHCDNADGSGKNIAGIYLKLPEMRGFALRGIDPTATYDPDGATRKVGDHQFYALRQHQHAIDVVATGNKVVSILSATAGITLSVYRDAGVAGTGDIRAANILPGPNIDSTETRMNNSAIRWCIRY